MLEGLWVPVHDADDAQSSAREGLTDGHRAEDGKLSVNYACALYNSRQMEKKNKLHLKYE